MKLLIVILCLLFAGCSTRGGFSSVSESMTTGPAVIEKSNGDKITLQDKAQHSESASMGKQPNNPEGEASAYVERDKDGVKAGANIPGSREGSALNSFWMAIAGYIVMAFGGIIWAAKRAKGINSGYIGLVANSLPKGGGLVIIGVGALMVWGHVLSPVIQLAGVGVAILLLGKWALNIRAQKQTGDRRDQMDTERDHPALEPKR